MNIEQIKTDLSAGVIVSPATWRKLVEAASLMQTTLDHIAKSQPGSKVPEIMAKTTLSIVEAM